MLERKDKIVDQLTGGDGRTVQTQRRDTCCRHGQGAGLARKVEVTDKDGNVQVLEADNVIIAAGSLPVNIPPAPVNGDTIVDSTGALEFQAKYPKRLALLAPG